MWPARKTEKIRFKKFSARNDQKNRWFKVDERYHFSFFTSLKRVLAENVFKMCWTLQSYTSRRQIKKSFKFLCFWLSNTFFSRLWPFIAGHTSTGFSLFLLRKSWNDISLTSINLFYKNQMFLLSFSSQCFNSTSK